MKNLNDIGNEIRRRRTAMGDEFFRVSHVRTDVLYAIEKGEYTDVPIDILNRIATDLGCRLVMRLEEGKRDINLLGGSE